MSISPLEQRNESGQRNSYEGREVVFESKEDKEKAELKKAAARERAEVVSKEVKNTKQQIQSIMASMQQVIKAVAAIRAQLQLAQQPEDNIPSVRSDKRRVGELNVKLMDLGSQLDGLKSALLEEERKRLREEGKLNGATLEIEANRLVEEILAKLKG
ncbi:MAG: hypothetical protein WCX97_04805 [Candidatus Magasanikbacteria bacterium]